MKAKAKKKSDDSLFMMSAEEFDEAFRRAAGFRVMVQVSPIMQADLEITAKQARRLANDGFGISHDRHHYSPEGNGCKIWARLSPYDSVLSLSLSSQWISEYYGELPWFT